MIHVLEMRARQIRRSRQTRRRSRQPPEPTDTPPEPTDTPPEPTDTPPEPDPTLEFTTTLPTEIEANTPIGVTARASNLEANVDYALGISVSDRLGIGNCDTQATGGTTIRPPGGTKSATIRACSTGSATISASLTYYDTKYKEERTLLRISHNITVESDEPCTNLTFQSATIPDQTWTTVTAVDVTLPSARGENCSPSYTLVGTSPNLGLPAGVSLRNTFKLSGTPTAAMARTEYTWTASDGATASRTFHITVTDTPPPSPPPPIPCNPKFGSASVQDQIWTNGVLITFLKLPVATGTNCNLDYSLTGTPLNPNLPAGVRIWWLTPPVLRGTPTVVMARTQYTWTATDKNDSTATASLTFHITVKPAPPTNLDVTPLLEGKARLSWTKPVGNPTGTRYGMDAMDPIIGNALVPQAYKSWTPIGITPTCASQSGASEEVCSVDIVLKDVIGPYGLDDSGAYRLRLKATSGALISYSDEVTIVDTPITRASGSSPVDSGRIFVKWQAMHGASGGRYAVRIANLDRTLPSQRPTYWIGNTTWRPPAEPPPREEPILEPLPSDREMTVSRLPGNRKLSVGADIYAIQLVYGPTTVDSMGNTTIQPKIFAARDSYVWPSNAPPQRPNLSDPDGEPLDYERIATYAFFGHHADREYNYRVCDSSYLSEGTRYDEWVALIQSAMEKWEDATNQEISAVRERAMEMDPECADLLTFPWNLIHQTNKNNEQSEIRVVNAGDGISSLALTIMAMSTDIYLGCLLNEDTDACVTSRPGYSGHGRHAGKAIPSVDITFKGSFLEQFNYEFNVPTSTPFNACRPAMDDQGNPIKYDIYELMLHEVGHALGLSNSAGPLDYLNIGGRQGYAISHPIIPDSVLNNDSRVRRDLAEPDCAPYPFDVMAIYALYQNVP